MLTVPEYACVCVSVLVCVRACAFLCVLVYACMLVSGRGPVCERVWVCICVFDIHVAWSICMPFKHRGLKPSPQNHVFKTLNPIGSHPPLTSDDLP